ncbi:MAG: hypothetical protein H6662_15735 [Ardenticatenaceae bacterium]|nr:hypothetical protein [Anaerolineales bacterium]MCB8923039.1 hypothetical protein [Ardenticatenaceae bacterium]
MNPIYQTLITTAVTAVVITIQHYTIGRWWQHNELARRTLGIATVLLISLALVATGAIRWQSWLIIAVLFGTAGATLAALVITEHELQQRKRTNNLRDAALRVVSDEAV